MLFIGDIVGSLGRQTLETYLPKLKDRYKPQLVVVNGENAASGRGITEKIAKQFYEWGAHAITMGNHTWDNKGIFDFIDKDNKIIRPANFPDQTPGKGYTIIRYNQIQIGLINLQGRTFLPAIDCPFRSADELIEKLKKETSIIFVDFHAEATSEKIAMGWYLDGRVSAVVGTHTHVQTSDERILPNGTAFITDVGMVGPRDGVLGMNRDAVIEKFITALPVRFEVVEEGNWQLNGVYLEIDSESGKTKKIERIALHNESKFYD